MLVYYLTMSLYLQSLRAKMIKKKCSEYNFDAVRR